jgi:hypothetical protein
MTRSKEFWDSFRSVFNPQEIFVDEHAEFAARAVADVGNWECRRITSADCR